MKTEVVVVSSTYVDGPSGRMFGTTVEGRGVADSESGFMCDGGAKSLVAASSISMRDTVRKLGEAMGNSERLRATDQKGKKNS